MTPTPETNLLLIEKSKPLAEFCATLADADRVAIDTEFVRERYYHPRLEIVQLTAGGQVAVIDMQAVEDPSALKEVLRNPKILKVFHAADQDLDVLRSALDVVPAHMFDTQVAASLLGYGAQVSLANLTRAMLDIDTGASHSMTDWTHRPLTPEQLAYAASDVQHLLDLEERLRAELIRRERLPWYEDEQRERMQGALEETALDESRLYKRVKDWMSLGRRDLAVLRELANWRERTARELNKPRRAIFSDEALVDLARFKPDSWPKAQKLRRINPGHLRKHFDAAQEAIKRGLAVPQEEWPDKPTGPRIDIPTGLLELCQALLRTEAERHDIAATVVATSSDLQQLIVHRDSLDPERAPLLHGWRRELVGGKLLALLSGQLAAVVGEGGKLEFRDVGE